MKKIIANLIVVAALLATLGSCGKNEGKELKKQYPFSISVQTNTKTVTNDDMSMSWTAGDAINLFHAAAGTSTIDANSVDGKFEVTDVNSGKFDGNLSKALEEGNAYDWYAIYPYNASRTVLSQWPSNDIIGHEVGKALVQNGNNSMTHLSGTACPLFGKALNITLEQDVSLIMYNLAAVVKITVKNTTNTPLIVKNISFTSPKTIIGRFFIHVMENPVIYKDKEDTPAVVSSTATLEVDNGEEIPAGGSADFYIAIKPHELAAGEKLTITVNGLSKEMLLKKAVAFAAGKIKPLTFNYVEKSYVRDGEPVKMDLTSMNFKILTDNGEAKVSANPTASGIIANLSDGNVGTFVTPWKSASKEDVLSIYATFPEDKPQKFIRFGWQNHSYGANYRVIEEMECYVKTSGDAHWTLVRTLTAEDGIKALGGSAKSEIGVIEAPFVFNEIKLRASKCISKFTETGYVAGLSEKDGMQDYNCGFVMSEFTLYDVPFKEVE